MLEQRTLLPAARAWCGGTACEFAWRPYIAAPLRGRVIGASEGRWWGRQTGWPRLLAPSTALGCVPPRRGSAAEPERGRGHPSIQAPACGETVHNMCITWAHNILGCRSYPQAWPWSARERGSARL